MIEKSNSPRFIFTLNRAINVGISFSFIKVWSKSLTTKLAHLLSLFTRIAYMRISSTFKFLTADIASLIKDKIFFINSMFTSGIKNNKVFNSIIKFVSVFMMNLLKVFKLTTKVFFHNISMFVNLFVVNRYFNVSMTTKS